ncbi:Uncharacterized protein TCM_046903 isoform 2 [Theobroma cacao]|uniref:Uncharacterized protein isoform 2 n=1 Tax=Theobroma cacao TaxID=3641 RepID=A0A061GIQ2_THECC|nr:Uncharacterized protein TCM_046903 isoform 2 [Theobroma cacao]
MASIPRFEPVTLLLFMVLSTALTISSGSGDGFTINGRVRIPQGLGTKGFALPGKISNVKVILNGGQNIREPFSIMSVVKSPMGLMVGFMLVVVFLMPKLVENMDPEEMRRAQEEMRNQGVPSLASLLPGGGRRSI